MKCNFLDEVKRKSQINVFSRKRINPKDLILTSNKEAWRYTGFMEQGPKINPTLKNWP